MIRLPGIAALVLVFGTVAMAFAGLFLAGPLTGPLPWAYLRGIVAFTTMQAALSTVLSLALGAALALALSRRARFPGRTVFVAGMTVASVLPPIVAVLGIVAVYGRSGWAGQAGGLFGVDLGGGLYGLRGILIAHAFFNVPLAALLFLHALAATPGEHWRLAHHLGMPPWAVFRLVDLPILAREAPAIAALIFLLCFTSFAVVLALGGGPGAATLEVAIFAAVRFEADFARAGLLALAQVAICLALAGPAVWFARRPGETFGAATRAPRPDAGYLATRVFDAVVLFVSGVLIVPPLAATVIAGLPALASLIEPSVARALATSLLVAAAAALLSVLLAVAIASLTRQLRVADGRPRLAGVLGTVGIAALAVPPVALSAGLFVVLRHVADPFALALPLIVVVNALMALPFALRAIEPALTVSAERYGRLAASLGIVGRNRIRIVDWPLLARPAGTALALAAALSLGDLGVASFFGSADLSTLPLLLHQRMGAYRMEEAASLALLLAVLVLGLFYLAQRGTGDALARSR